MEQGKFRKKRNKFSQISNVAIQDETMSPQARFLYCLISSYISIPDFTLYKSFIKKKASLGKDAFQKYWNELKTKGYLLQYELRDEKGKYYYEYELLDEPSEEENNEKTEKSKVESSASESDKAVVGFSGYGKQRRINNINKNNNNYNNTLTNNNTIDKYIYNKRTSSKVVDKFLDTVFVAEKGEYINSLGAKIKKLFKNLKPEEIQSIAQLDETSFMNFYSAIVKMYNDNKIRNKEGFLRSMLKDIPSFIDIYNKQKPCYCETLEVYDSSKNREVTEEEIRAFYELRGREESSNVALS